MPRHHVERHQLPFPFAEQPQETKAPAYGGYRPNFANLGAREADADRFVYTVNEPWFITHPANAANYLFQHIFTDPHAPTQEELWALLLNTKFRITHHALLYRGRIDAVPIRVAEVFRDAVRVGAAGLILAHCHPSGDPNPSPEDIKVTELLQRASELLGIDLVDHIIVGERDWISLREQKLGFA